MKFNLKKFLQGLLNFLKGILTKAVLKKVLGTAIGGVRGFVITTVINIVFKKYVRPGYNWLVNRVISMVKRKEIKKKVEKIKNAKTESDFDAAVDDL